MTVYPHRIRLRGPWQYDCPAASGRVVLPSPLVAAGLAVGADVRLTRPFGRPGHLDPGERVLIFVEAPAAPLSLALDGMPLGRCDGDAEWDVTGLLRDRNELVVVTAVAGGAPWVEVGMLIRRTAYLRGVRFSARGSAASVEGEVVGSADGPLDLYLVADRHNVAYVAPTATEGGTPFALSGECPEGPPSAVKVELVCGAEVWYAVESVVSAPDVRGQC